MTVDLHRMRKCFAFAAVWCRWDDADQADIGAEIKAAVESGDEARITWWAAWLEEVSGLAEFTAQCRAMEARIRTAAAERKAA